MYVRLREKTKNKLLFIWSSVSICVGLSEIFELMIQFWVESDMSVGVAFGYLLVRYRESQKNNLLYDLLVLKMVSIALVLVKEKGLVFLLASG